MNEDAAQLKKEEQPEEEVQSSVEEQPSGEEKTLSSEEVQLGPKALRKENDEDAGNKDEIENDAPPADAPPMPPSMPMIIVLGLIAMLSGVLVVLVYELTAPIIAEKERLALEAAVFQVVPGVDPEKARQSAFFIDLKGNLTEYIKETEAAAKADKREPFYVVYDDSDALLGIAMQGAAQGYQDIVRTLFGYDIDKQQIVGMTILKSVDTPGLGDKKTVEKNKLFMANFDALDVSLTGDKSAIKNSIKTVKHGAKTQSHEVDAMSGATITSRAIAKGMAKTTGDLLPSLVKQLPVIRSAAVKAHSGETTGTEVKN